MLTLSSASSFVITIWIASVAAQPDSSDSAVSNDHMLHLAFDERTSHFLNHTEPWRPSQSTLITALAANQTLHIVLDLLHVNARQEVPICILQYNCGDLASRDFQNLSLPTLNAGKATTLCEKIRPFTVTADTNFPNQFNLSLTQTNSVQFERAMTHILELRIHVLFVEGETSSGSLFILNLDALSKLNDKPEAISGIQVTKHILTNEAVRFFINLTSPQTTPPQTGSVRQFKLFDQKFLDALKSSSDLIRSALHVSALVRGNRECSDNLTADSTDILFTSGDSHVAFTSLLSTQLASYIHLQRGILIYSETTLIRQREKLATTFAGKPVRLCLRISLNTPVWSYHLTLHVADLKPDEFSKIDDRDSTKDACKRVNARKNTWKTLTEGMQDVLLLSPIVCGEISRQMITVSHNNVECTNMIVGSQTPWQKCDGGLFEISTHGNAVLLKTVQQRNAGIYKFAGKNLIFEYYITVLALPTFNTPTKSGTLPHTTYANLDLRVTFGCTVYHDGMMHLTLKPVFRVINRDRLTRWRELNVDQFALTVLKMAPNSIVVRSKESKESGNKFINMQVGMPHVVETWRTWVLIFTCRAETYDHKERAMGMPHYKVETSTDVVYFGKRFVSSPKASTTLAAAVLLLGLLCLVQLLARHLLD